MTFVEEHFPLITWNLLHVPSDALVFRKPAPALRVESMVVPIPYSPSKPESGSLKAVAEEPAAFALSAPRAIGHIPGGRFNADARAIFDPRQGMRIDGENHSRPRQQGNMEANGSEMARCAQIEANAISTAHRDSDSNWHRKRAPGWSLPSQRSSRT